MNEEHERERRSMMGELPANQNYPQNSARSFRSGQEVPPDLYFRETYRGRSGPTDPVQAQNEGDLNANNNAQLFRALRRQGYFVTQPFKANPEAQVIRGYETRTYLLIQNIATAGDIYIGFGNEPTPNYSLTLTPGDAYEPFTVPVNEIYVLGSTADVDGFIVYSRETD